MKYVFIILFLFLRFISNAQGDSASLPPQHLYGFYLRSGETVVHTVAVENIRGAKPFVVELEAAKRRVDYDSWNKSGCFAPTGFLLSYFNFNSSILGKGAALSYFIRPAYRIGNRLTAYYQAGIGLDYLSKPYNETTHPANRNYSLYVNPYMHIGAGISYQPAKHVILTVNGVFIIPLTAKYDNLIRALTGKPQQLVYGTRHQMLTYRNTNVIEKSNIPAAN